MTDTMATYSQSVTLLATIILIGIPCCLATELSGYYRWICSGNSFTVSCHAGMKLVFTSGWYGIWWQGKPACGALSRPASNCHFHSHPVEDFINNWCFGKERCLIEASDRALQPQCNDKNNVLWYTGFCVPANHAHKLCETSMISNSNWGYIFAFAQLQGDCQLVFDITKLESVQLKFIRYRLNKRKVLVTHCGNELSLTMHKIASPEVNGERVNCDVIIGREYDEPLILRGPAKLKVESKALETGYGFILHYVTIGTTIHAGDSTSPLPMERTEQTNLDPVSTGPKDGSVTAPTMFRPPITRFGQDGEFPQSVPTEPTKNETLRTTIIIVCVILLVAIIATPAVVILLVVRSRRKTKHIAEVQSATQALDNRHTLHANTYETHTPQLTPQPQRR